MMKEHLLTFRTKYGPRQSGQDDGSILLTELFIILSVFFHFRACWFFFFLVLKAKRSLSSKEWHLPHLCDNGVFVCTGFPSFSFLGFVIRWRRVTFITEIACSRHSQKFEETYCLGVRGSHFKVHLPLFLWRLTLGEDLRESRLP